MYTHRSRYITWIDLEQMKGSLMDASETLTALQYIASSTSTKKSFA
jgi:hypothetical protein